MGRSAAALPDALGIHGKAAEPFRVVHVLKHCGQASGNVHVAVDLACMQAQAGYDVFFASEGGTFLELLTRYGVRHLYMRQRIGKPLDMLRSSFELLSFCRRRRPHVIHAHMTSGAVLGYMASRASGVPLVTTVHNSFDPQSVLMRLGRVVVAVSEAERQNLIRRGCRPEAVVTVLNAAKGSPRESFLTNHQAYCLNRPCIAVICALHRRKGVFDVIAAFQTLAAAFPQWHLHIAGEGPDRAELEAQAAATGYGERITFLGFVNAPQTLFEQLDIFVLASYADPCSLSIGEARSAGCAIVATSVGGTTEMLEHGAAGRLVPPGDPAALAQELRQLMQNPIELAKLRQAARDGAEKFDVRLLVDRYEAVYRRASGLS